MNVFVYFRKTLSITKVKTAGNYGNNLDPKQVNIYIYIVIAGALVEVT